MRRDGLSLILAGFLALWTCPLGVAAADCAPGWQLVKNQDGIRLYKKEKPGSNYSAFKATTVINTTMAAVGAVLRDVAAYPQWMAKIAEATIIKQYDPNTLDIYLVMDFPWPTSDRDTVVKGQTTVDKSSGDVLATARVIPDADVPLKPDLVRLPRMDHQFHLVYQKYRKTKLSFTLFIDAGGNLPAFTVNPATQAVPFESLKNLKSFIRQEKYLSADPLDPVNIPITQTIIKAILEKYITETALIDLIVSDPDLMKMAITGGYEKKAMIATASAMIRKYVASPMWPQAIEDHPHQKRLSQAACHPELLKAITADGALAQRVLKAGGLTAPVKTAMANRIKAALD